MMGDLCFIINDVIDTYTEKYGKFTCWEHMESGQCNDQDCKFKHPMLKLYELDGYLGRIEIDIIGCHPTTKAIWQKKLQLLDLSNDIRTCPKRVYKELRKIFLLDHILPEGDTPAILEIKEMVYGYSSKNVIEYESKRMGHVVETKLPLETNKPTVEESAMIEKMEQEFRNDKEANSETISAEELVMIEKMEQEFRNDKEANNETISAEESAMIEKMEQEFLNQSNQHKKVIIVTNNETISAEELAMIEKMEQESMNPSKKNSKRGRDIIYR